MFYSGSFISLLLLGNRSNAQRNQTRASSPHTTTLRVKEVMVGGPSTASSLFFQHLLVRTPHCPSLSAMEGTYTAHHIHTTSEATLDPPAARHIPPAMGRAMVGRQQQMEEVQPCHFLQLPNLHHAAAKPLARAWLNGITDPTQQQGSAWPAPTQERQDCSSCSQARESQSQLHCVLSSSHETELLRQYKPRSVCPC